MSNSFCRKAMITKKFPFQILLSFVWLLILQFGLALDCSAQKTAAKKPDYIIVNNKKSVAYPFELIDNRIFINVKINNQDTFRFILDSGIGNVITPEAATKLGLKSSQIFQTAGVGDQRVEAWRTVVSRIAFGGIEARNQKFTVISLEPLRKAIGFDRLDGVIGFSVFNSLVADIDYEKNLLTFTKPSAFVYQGRGIILPIDFTDVIPQINAEIDGFRGKVKIDTGDRSTMTLYVPFVEKNELRGKYAPKFETVTGWGIGGPVRAQVTRVKKFSLGGIEVESLVARMPRVKIGEFTDTKVMASVGTGFLKRFNITFDYSRKRIILEKNQFFNAPDVYDRAGMWLSQGANAFEVIDVIAESPAEKAGIKAGDKILAVDVQSVDKLSLPEARLTLKSDSKKVVKLIVESSDGSRREASLILEDLV